MDRFYSSTARTVRQLIPHSIAKVHFPVALLRRMYYNPPIHTQEVRILRAVITIVGKDAVGILAKTANVCAAHNANIVDVTQTVMGDIFSMVMLADIEKMEGTVGSLGDDIEKVLEGQGLVSHVMHEDIFNAMHRI